MIIARGRGYIFVHIPKTGGTAMALALENRVQKDDILIGDTPKAQRRRGRLAGVASAGRLWKHSKLADAEGLLTREEMAQMFVFSMVRNPWDRMVSYYHWLLEQRFDHPAVVLAKASDFATFVQNPHTIASLRTHSYRSYTCDGDGTNHCNLFARLEYLEADLVPLWRHLGFTLDLPYANRSARRADWRPYYDDATTAVVAECAASDIARFGYTFDP